MIFDIIKLLPTLMAVAPDIKKWIDIGLPILTELNKDNPKLVPVFENLGKELFPNAKDLITSVAAVADALFDPNGTKWLQKTLNTLMGASLTVDGVYGKMTKAAVTQFQTDNQPTTGTIDGWAGPKTKKVMVEKLGEQNKLAVSPSK